MLLYSLSFRSTGGIRKVYLIECVEFFVVGRGADEAEELHTNARCDDQKAHGKYDQGAQFLARTEYLYYTNEQFIMLDYLSICICCARKQ